MCTLTVHRNSERVLVTMNRDESRLRGEESPPELSERGATPRTLAPRDGNAGGTWIGVNDRGLVACLLNLYEEEQAAPRPSGMASRGELIPRILESEAHGSARDRFVAEFDRIRYLPLELAIFSSVGGTSLLWRGKGDLEATVHPGEWTLLSSSSWIPQEVLPWRRELFRNWREEGERWRGPIPEFHLLQPEGREYWSPLLSRENASTRSLTQVEVPRDGGSPVMRYWPRPTVDLDPASAIEMCF